MIQLTLASESIRHKSISLDLFPRPFMEEPTTYNPQSKKKKYKCTGI